VVLKDHPFTSLLKDHPSTAVKEHPSLRGTSLSFVTEHVIKEHASTVVLKEHPSTVVFKEHPATVVLQEHLSLVTEHASRSGQGTPLSSTAVTNFEAIFLALTAVTDPAFQTLFPTATSW